MGCERRNESDAGIGMKCHELGHALGLPDLYDGSGSSNGLGHWCMMSAGSWLNEDRPANFSAWCRVKLEWENPRVVQQTDYNTYSLDPSAVNANAVLRINTFRPDEYFLLENRQRFGNDYRLPGTGLAIYHLNANKLNREYDVNTDRDNPGIRLVEADFSPLGGLYNAKDRGKAADLFPGSTQQTAFGPYTSPHSNFFDGTYCGINIQNITESDAVITFELLQAPPVIVWDSSIFRESPDNDGSIQNTITINLLEEEFTVEPGIFPGNIFHVENLPKGLSLTIEAISSTEAKLTINGNAFDHASADNVYDLACRFNNEAFKGGDASAVNNAIKENLEIRFADEKLPNVLWVETFENYEINQLPDNWEVIVNKEGTYDVSVTGEEDISCDAATFYCQPYEGEKALTTAENWLGDGPAKVQIITPLIDLIEASSPELAYSEIRGWDNEWPQAKPEHTITIEYTEDKANWYKLTTVTAGQDDFTQWNRVDGIDLSACQGKKVWLSFTLDTHTYYWRIDDIKIAQQPTAVNYTGIETCNIYPNPVDEKLAIVSDTPFRKVKLLNLAGNVLQEKVCKTKKLELDLSSLHTGIYLLQVTLNTETIVKKIVKK